MFTGLETQIVAAGEDAIEFRFRRLAPHPGADPLKPRSLAILASALIIVDFLHCHRLGAVVAEAGFHTGATLTVKENCPGSWWSRGWLSEDGHRPPVLFA